MRRDKVVEGRGWRMPTFDVEGPRAEPDLKPEQREFVSKSRNRRRNGRRVLGKRRAARDVL
jgi:hypothetical protein